MSVVQLSKARAQCLSLKAVAICNHSHRVIIEASPSIKPCVSSDYSELGVQNDGADFTAALADVVAVALSLAVIDAPSHFWNGVNQRSTDTRADSDVLLGVAVVSNSRELVEKFADVAVGVDDVGGLSQVDAGQVELGDVLGVDNVDVVVDIEG